MALLKGMNARPEHRYEPWKRLELQTVTAKYRRWERSSCLAQIKTNARYTGIQCTQRMIQKEGNTFMYLY
jgi:hypothetical protein